jgi:lysophospholipase L1-like esterase
VKRFFLKSLLVLFGLMVGLLIAEIALRIIGYSAPYFHMTDRYRGVALRPGVEGWYQREGKQYIRINSEGLRDREHSKVKPENRLRIAVIGDSYAEAFQVPPESAFWAVMEKRLQECGAFGGREVEVINFGVSGYGTAQELITLRRQVWDYSPDIVLLAVTTNNDITDNSRALKRSDIPYFVYRDGQLTLDDSFQNSRTFRLRSSAVNNVLNWIRNRSRVIQAIDEASRAIKIYMTRERAPASSPPANGQSQEAVSTPQSPSNQRTPPFEEVGIDNMIYREPADAVWEDAWRVTEGLIKLMNDEVRSKGAKFLVVTLSNGIQVYPDPQARQDFMRRVGSNDLFYPDLRIKNFCEHEGIPVLTLAPQLQAYAEEHNVFLHGFDATLGSGHWNPLGHRVAGEMIAQRLCENSVTAVTAYQ